MDHTQAVATMAAERYLLRELSNPEIEAFEEHYFDCTECTQAILDGSAVLDGGRSLVRQNVHRRARGPLTWVPIAAAVAFGAVALYTAPMAMRVPGLVAQVHSYAVANGRPLSVEAIPLFSTARAGAAAPIRFRPVVRNTAELEIVPPNDPFPQYRIDIRDALGRSRGGSLLVSAEEAKNRVPLSFAQLQPGKYSLVVDGVSADGKMTQIDSMPFDVQ